MNRETYQAFTQELSKMANEQLFNKLRDSTKTKVIVDNKDPIHKQTGGAYYHLQNRTVHLADKNHEYLAHELGHAEIDKNPLGYLLQSRIGRGLGNAAPSFALINALRNTATGTSVGRQVGDTAAIVALTAPLLAQEGLASYKVVDILRSQGATPEELDKYKAHMVEAWKTYATQATTTAAIGGVGIAATALMKQITA